ncbi:caspase domain-containing protein [Cerioporus squamosus]|nr:caspase domain-containing protein [Cerioporus squamosus]
MMWDFSGGANNGQGAPPYHAQNQAPPYPSPPAGFGVVHSGPPPQAPFMPIGAPTTANSYSPSYLDDTGPWIAPGTRSAPVPREPVAAGRGRVVEVHYTTHHSSSHRHSHSHSHPQHVSHSHSPRPTAHHSSSQPAKITKPYRPPPEPIQHLQPAASSSHDHPHFFQYSKCTGRRRALCIGINYKGQPNELYGCINDARNVVKFLRRHGYKSEDIVLLTDDATDPRSRPTRANILDAMHWLVKGAQPHDSLFFHYSGHGGQVKDRDGDERDGYDEIIFPLDHKRTGYIVDDLMHTIMVKKLPVGCRLTALFDSCHSGSVLDLPYLYSSNGRVKGSQVTAKWLDYKSTTADVISWSGCKDSQTSADTWEAGTATGAMSFAFMSSLQQNPNATYQELLRAIRVILKKKYSQKPQLTSSHHIDTNLKFIF